VDSAVVGRGGPVELWHAKVAYTPEDDFYEASVVDGMPTNIREGDGRE
jgi:hypothetical protein